jgi:hypothetical protein
MKDSSAQEMDMKVIHRLPCAGAIVDNGPVAATFDAALACEFRGHAKEVSQQAFVFGLHYAEGFQVDARHDQQMNRGLRMQILDRHRSLILVNDFGGRFAPDDLTENAILHLVSVSTALVV